MENKGTAHLHQVQAKTEQHQRWSLRGATPAASQRMRQAWARVASVVGVGVAVLLLLLIANLVSLRVQGSRYTLNVGFRADRHMLQGFFSQEEDAHGTRYRWTKSESTIMVQGFAAVPRGVVSLHVGWLPPGVPVPRPLQLAVDGTEWVTLPINAAPRRYTMLLPPGTLHDGNMLLGLQSETSRVPPDRRDIGIRLDRVEIGWPAGDWVLPTWRMLLVQWLMVMTGLAVAWRLDGSWRVLAAVAVVGVVLLGWLTGHSLLIAAPWVQALLLASGAVLVLVWATFPRLSRMLPGGGARAELRVLLLLTIVLLAVRLLAALYPVFDSHDWYIHRDRLEKLEHGSLLLYDKPAEFSTRLAIVPPALYILVAPLSLLTTSTVTAMQGFYAFADGCAVLLLALFVRQLGGSGRAALLAALVLGLLPLQYTALWWGFGPQVVGQALILLLALFVLQPRLASRWLWLAAGGVFCLILLMHIGTGLLGGFWLAGYVALVLLVQRRQHPHWQGWGLLLLAVGLVVTLLLYSQVLGMHMRGLAHNQRLAWSEDDIFRVQWTLGSLYYSFRPLTMWLHPDVWQHGWIVGLLLTLLVNVLVVVSLVFLVYRARGRHRLLVLAWLASGLLFFGIDLVSGLQIRYAYFLVPLICAGLALLLDRLIARHRLGWLVAGCVLGIIGMMGLKLWFDGVVLASKPSLRGLTH